MADTFFGFDTSLPSLGEDSRRNFLGGDEPDEEEYNALNDETFGCDDTCGVWEPDEELDVFHDSIPHNGLSSNPIFDPEVATAEEEETVHQINASIKQLDLDEEENEPILLNSSRNASSPINVMNHGLGTFGHSFSPPGLITRDEIGSPQTHSIWATSTKSSSSFEDRFSSPLSSNQRSGPSLKLSSPFTLGFPLYSDTEGNSYLNRSQPQINNEFAIKNDWMWGSRMPLNSNKMVFPNAYGVSPKVGGSQQLNSALGKIRRVSPGSPLNLSLQSSYYSGNHLEDTLNNPHLANYNQNRLLNNRYQTFHKSFDHANFNKSPQGLKDFKNGYRMRNEKTQRQWYDSRPTDADKPYDEYAGLMTNKEKNWLIHIQLLQLNTDKPYIDDYYYTAYMMKKMTKQRLEEGSGDQEPSLILPESHRTEAKAYTPPQIENSLGRLQVVSVLAPRKIIDVTVVSADAASPRENVKPCALLLDIEMVYDVLLKLQGLDKQLQCLQDGPIKDYTHKDRLVHLSKIHKYMSVRDRLQLLWLVRKGKTLLLRVEPYLEKSQKVAAIEVLLCNLARIIKRDHGDNLLPSFLTWAQEVINNSSFENVVTCGTQIVSPSPEITDQMTVVLSDRVGFTLIMLLIQRGELMYPESAEKSLQNKWCDFVSYVVEIVITSKVKCVPMLPVKSILDRLSQLPIKGGKLRVFMDILSECEVSSGSGDS